MGKVTKYSLEEDEYIKECVRKHPTNLQQAFRICATELNRPQSGISVHYYSSIAPKRENKCFLTISSKKTSTNYKVTRKGKRPTKVKPAPTKKSKWKRILEILAE